MSNIENIDSFMLGRIVYETRVKEAWGSLAEKRLKAYPYPEHIGAERTADVDLAIAVAKSVIKYLKENQ